jgi:hypothetical protein
MSSISVNNINPFSGNDINVAGNLYVNGGAVSGFPYTGSAEITGSLGVTGSVGFAYNSIIPAIPGAWSAGGALITARMGYG